MFISVIIPTYNPELNKLQKVIEALVSQFLPASNWECIVIDNKSTDDFTDRLDLPIGFRIVKEEKQGLTYARLRGISEAKYDIIVMVDDDNLLDRTYLGNSLDIFNTHPKLGAIGGRSIPLFETEPDEYIKDFYSLLALRDLGSEVKIQSLGNKYPEYAPIGAGMAFRKIAVVKYTEKVLKAGSEIIADRKGASLGSSGDNDMVMEILKDNWDVGYFPQLSLKHIIGAGRLTRKYLSKLNFGIQKSWVQFLLQHNLSPWPRISSASVPFRKIKAFFNYKPWQNNTAYINWCGACGMFEGMAK